MLGRHLQKVLHVALQDVQRRNHEFLTLEHLLYAMATESQGRMLLEGCGASPAVLREQLEGFFAYHMELRHEDSSHEIIQTESVQRVLSNALHQIRSAGRELVELGDVLAALMEESDTYALYYLKKQGVERAQVLEYISHGGHGSGSTGTRRPSQSEDGEDEGVQDALEKYAVELTAKAAQGKIDPLVGRNSELDRTVEVLCRRRKNNPLFVGEPGVGKTAMAEGLALRIVEGKVPDAFKEARIFSLDMGSLLAGARYRGDFENRLKNVIKSITKIPHAVLFIDEIHTIVGAGSTSGGAMDASNLLKPVLANGEIRCMGSTTHEELRNHLEKDRALSRRFQRIDIKEPSSEECLAILQGLQGHYAEHHNVTYAPATLKAIVDLSARHIQDKLLPDKAIDVLDEAGAAVALKNNHKKSKVVMADVERIVARMAGIPERSVSGKERDKLATLEKDVLAKVFGQDEAVSLTVKSILRARAGINRENRPAGSFLFYGPTGVGKTELAKQLADRLGVQFLRYDMSEYMEKHAVSRLIGAPPGYVGYDQGGQLTEAIRKAPYSLVLLDEIEKAHPDIFNVLLQVMDYGTLTDNTGRKADFRNVIIIMTSNAGVREMNAKSLGFAQQKTTDTASKGLKAVENTFAPEFRNRLDALIPFRSLTPELMEHVVDKFVAQLSASLEDKKIHIVLTSAAKAWFATKGYDATYGARPLQRLMRSELEDALAQEILFGKLVKGGLVTIDVKDDALSFDFAKVGKA